MASQDTTYPPSGVVPPAGKVIAVGLNKTLEKALSFKAIRAGRVVTEVGSFDALDDDAVMDSDVVISPIVAPDFDAIELATYLAEAEFAGTYVAVGIERFEPTMIKREIRNVAPALLFDVKIVRAA